MTASTHEQALSEYRDHLHPPLEPSLDQADVSAGPADLEGMADVEDGIPSGDDGASFEPSAAPHETVLALADDKRYLTVLTLMQQGAWSDILPLIKELKGDYPHDAVLDGLLNEAQLKVEIVTRWEAKIKGRRFTVAHERLLRRSLPFLIMMALAMGGLIFYQNFVAPSRAVFALARTNQAMIEDAQARFQSGRYQEAIALYEQVLSTEPDNSSAQQGRLEAHRHLDLATKYDMAMTVSAAGNTQRAQVLFESIHARAPQFRDVETKLKQIQVLAEAQQLFDEAEDAYSGHRWLDAVTKYEHLITIAGDHQAEVVQKNLTEAYLHAGEQLVAQQPMENLGPEAIRDYFRQGMSADQVVAQAEIDLLDDYLRGEKFEKRGDLRDAIDAWEPLYDERPRYLGGYLAEELYSAYLALATQRVQKRDLDEAETLYQLAVALQVSDTGEAQTRLAEVVEQVATPVPTPVPTKRIAYAAPAPPTPTPVLTQAYQGWIAFRTSRNGGEEIYVMRPDGVDQQPAPAEIASQFDTLYADERWSPDHTREAYVHTPGNGDGTDIYIREGDVGVTMLSDFPGHEYDPVWSPDGQWVAFVSNYTGNDEIWAMRVDGSDLRQLTANAWEWDKHPSWSPDGSQVTFFSNRTGTRQIWTITLNGYQEWNASYSNFDDWDPIWIK